MDAVQVGGMEVSSNSETADEMLANLEPKVEGAASRVVMRDGKPVEEDPEKSETSRAASKLGKKGGEAAAAARAAKTKDALPAPAKKETKAEPEREEPAAADGKAKKEGDPRKDPEARVREATAELAEERRQRAEERAALQRRIDAIEARLSQGGAAPKDAPAGGKPAPAAEGKPKPQAKDFESYEEYTEALTDWKLEEKLNKLNEQQGHSAAAKARTDAAVSEVQGWTKAFKEAIEEDPTLEERLPDFRAVVQHSSHMVKPDAEGKIRYTAVNVMSDEILRAGGRTAVLLAEHLHNNDEARARILALPNRTAIREAMLRLGARLERDHEAALATPPAPSVPSKAKPPMEPVKPKPAAEEPDLSNVDDFDEFARLSGHKRRR